MPLDNSENPLDTYHHLNLSLGLSRFDQMIVEDMYGDCNVGFARAFNCAVANMIRAYELGKDIIAISHRPATYTRNRYNKYHVGYTSMVKHVVPHLIELGWIELLKLGFGDRRGDWFNEKGVAAFKNRRRTTRYRISATQWHNLSHGIFNKMLVEQADRGSIILRGSGGLVNYKDDNKTDRLRNHLETFNAFLDNQEITHPEINKKSVRTQKHFKRSFKYTFNHGGRFYGHWVVTLPKEQRQQLLFNNEPVCELDYSAMHPHILYSLKGLDYAQCYNDGDPYNILGLTRGEAKAAFNVALNNKTKRGFSVALKHKLIEDGVAVPQIGFKGTPYRNALEDKLHHVVEYFYKGKSSMWGLRCQYIDSCIMETLLDELMALDVCCIPMHDGIIVPRSKMNVTKALMEKVWKEQRKTPSPCVKLEY